MGDRKLLIAAVALIATGMVGAAATAAVLSATSPDRDRSGEPGLYGRDGGRGETTATPGPRRGPGGPFPDDGDFESAGERIWYTGVGEEGAIPREPSFGPGMMGGCAVCHGEDGRGSRFRMMGRRFDAPDIRYSTLTSPHEEDGETEEPWTDEDIGRAVREGIEPDGSTLRDTMPRWKISDRDLADLLAHMKTL